MNDPAKPERLFSALHERVWGSTELVPWFPNSSRKVGEVWFERAGLEVLVKFLFATENLSVQVHPGDELARQSGYPRGKTEMWHILRAAPNSQIALGFASPVTEDLVRRAAADGSIMGLLRWIPVRAGETWFVPAGAVHAIGRGITLCEIQQNSDLTYRLYDYGRGRELHVDEAIRALNLDFEPAKINLAKGLLVDCPYFEVDLIDLDSETVTKPVSLFIALEGNGLLNGASFEQGQVFYNRQPAALSLSGRARALTVLTRTSTDLAQG